MLKIDIENHRKEVVGTQFMYLKNVTKNVLACKDADGNEILIQPGTYEKFKPSKPENYGKLFFKKSTCVVEM